MSGRRFDRRYFWLLPLPALIYGLYYAVLLAVQDPGFMLEVERPMGRSGAEIQRQFFWVSVFAVSVAVSLVVGLQAGWMVWTRIRARDRWIGLGFFVLAMGFAIGAEMFATGPRFYAHMGAGLFEAAFCGSQACPLLRQLDFGLDATKFAGAFALSLLSLAFVLSLRVEPGEDGAAAQARARREQDMLLYRGAAVYVFACLAMVMWMFWPLPYLGADAAAEYRALMTGQAVLVGVGYSLGTASIFLPAALALSARGQSDLVEMQEKAGGIPLDQLRRLGAMVLPAVVAFLPFLEPLFW